MTSDLVAPAVLSSWRRSRALHVHPDRVEPPFMREPDTDTPLVQAATPVLRRIASDLASQAVSVILTSADGLVLQRIADPSMAHALDDVRLAQGYSYAEQFAGTNGIGTTLETRRPTYIRGSEHYLGPLGGLACAGSPIRDPMSGRLLGVVDLTCWAHQADPLLFVLAKSAGSQIEDRITALNNETETALLDAYLRHGRRYPGGVVAIGGEVVLVNQHLRELLDAADQAALLDHAAEIVGSATTSTAVIGLPTGHFAKISVAEEITARGRGASAVLHVHIQDPMVGTVSAGGTAMLAIPKLSGRSSSWRRSCHQVERSYRDRDWIVIEGERGTGRTKLAQAVAQHVTPDRSVRIHRLAQYRDPDDFIADVETHTDGDDFAVVIANIDELPEDMLDPLAAVLQSRSGRGWIAASMGAAARSPSVDLLLLPFFTHTVGVAPLRHRVEDLDDLVPTLLTELTRGADVHLGPDAMHQLAKLPWPGNVTQLRKVLAATVAQQRSGVIGADKLPAECRSRARRTLTPLEALERDAIVRSLQENSGNKAVAAEALGMSRATIYRKIRDFGIA